MLFAVNTNVLLEATFSITLWSGCVFHPAQGGWKAAVVLAQQAKEIISSFCRGFWGDQS